MPAARTPHPDERFLRREEVCERLGIGLTKFDEWLAENEWFRRRAAIPFGTLVWAASDVAHLIHELGRRHRWKPGVPLRGEAARRARRARSAARAVEVTS